MTNTPSPDEDRELIERLRSADPLFAIEPREIALIALVLDQAADRIESLLSDRAKLEEALREIVDTIEMPRYGDDSVWGDLTMPGDFGGPSAIDKARAALNRSTDRAT